jgi:segregation and condensation protein A
VFGRADSEPQYQLKLPVFEGPLDLLLHLIQKQELNIYDIPIAAVTEQYVAYLATMRELDLEIASEFLVMAATLLALKARQLLPKPEKAEPLDGEEEEIDPRQALVDSLIEYRRYKEVAAALRGMEETQALRFWRPPEEAQPVPPGLSPEVTLADLVAALRQVAESLSPEEPALIKRDEITLRDKMRQLLRRLSLSRKGLNFGQITGSNPSRLNVVVSFLAVLELIRQRRVVVQQPMPFGEMIVYYRPPDAHEAAVAGEVSS